mgnify:CR=1 FL=1
MTAKIDQKITGYRVKTEEQVKPAVANIEQMHEAIARPDALYGVTYKIKPNGADHALYITINDIILNEGTDHQERRPYEIFLNSKNMEQFQWVLALTRLASAVFRKGGDVKFMVDELKNVFDPKGGYWKKSLFMPSVVAEIGHVLERHLISIGMIQVEVDPHMEAFLAEKREQLNPTTEGQLCSKCNTKSVIRMDGCMTCTACGDSKCG